MNIHDLYSKRKKRIEHGNQPEIYQYETLPIKFRRQVIHIWYTAIVPYEKFVDYTCWQGIHKILTRELGEFSFSLAGQLSILPNINNNPFEECQEFLLNTETSTDNLLDLIELTFNRIDRDIRYLNNTDSNISSLNAEGFDLQHPDDAIEELNHRFREHAVGYQYSNGQIIRVDSGFIHSEVVIPALKLLSNQCFAGAEQEFLSAHRHYRQQDYKPAIVDALKSFESTMKIICDGLNWNYSKNDTAAKLIGIIFEKKLIPDYLQNHMTGLRSILEGGIPTVRNKTSGHGQGSQPTAVPEYLAAYVLHVTASNIVFLMEAYMAKIQGNEIMN
jgi:AbiJ N-terminal domain 4